MKQTIKYFLLLVLISCSTLNITSNEKNYLLNDENSSKYYLIEFIRKAQSEKKLGEIPMLIIDGEPIFYYYKENVELIQIKKSEIKNIEIIESKECVKLFGAACKYGLIRIKTY